MSFVRFSCLIAVFAALPSVGHALPYFGTFTQTIEYSNVPEVYVGTEYYGYYTYKSDTMDGTFGTYAFAWYGMNATLSGHIFVPFASEVDTGWEIKTGGIPAYWSTLQNTSQIGSITIQDGQVTDFWWSHEVGGFYMQASLSGFEAISFYDTWYKDDLRETNMPRVGGSIRFTGGPRVPDIGSSVCMLALGLLGLGLARRKVWQCSRSNH